MAPECDGRRVHGFSFRVETVGMLTFEDPPKSLRLLTTADRINSGREYGPGFEARVVAAGDRADVRVYARKVSK